MQIVIDKLCEQCKRKCKQVFEVVNCPKFEKKEEKK